MEETILEMLDKALAQQRRSVKAYEMMISAANDPADRQLLHTLRREDRRHYYLLEGIYEEISGRGWNMPRFSLVMPKQYCTMLQVMICDKLDVIDYYQKLGDTLECAKQKELMDIIVSDQKEQARLLATVYKNRC